MLNGFSENLPGCRAKDRWIDLPAPLLASVPGGHRRLHMESPVFFMYIVRQGGGNIYRG